MEYDAYGRPLRGSYFDDSIPPSDSHHYEHRDSLNNPPKWNHAQQRYSPPLVNSDRMSNASDSTSKAHENVSPDLIAQITEKVKREVMEHLKATGSVDEAAKPPPPMQRQPSSSNRSSISASSPPPRRVYTPPSPVHQSLPPKNAYTETARSPPASPLDKPSVRFSDRAPPPPPKPAAAARSYSNAELSTIDQKWGRLFDSDGRPTQRLGAFLRGLANHIIDDIQPKKSIVITPSKMAIFYATHALEVEPHPLLSIFRAQSNEQISQLYQDLGCSHHLVQEQASQPCIVPSLTPVGFAHWMTLRILAYPEEEWKRLEKICLAMPVDADGEMVDGKPERLPKQISRYLLPELEDRKNRKLLDNAILDFLDDIGKTPTRKKSISSPPPPLNRQSSTSQRRESSSQRHTRPPVELHQDIKSPNSAKSNPIERERKPYSGAPGSDVSSNDDTGIKIERERQPYTAQPGNGRTYENLNPPDRTQRDRANSASRPKDDIPDPRHTRTHSDARRDSYIPTPRPGGRRTSSPPIKSFSHSTPAEINNSSNSTYGPGPSSSTAGFPPPQSTFSPRSYGTSSSAFPPPPPMEGRGERREAYTGRRIPDDEPGRSSGDFTSPRDAERWDRYQESRPQGDGFGVPYDRGPIPIDPRDGVPLNSRGGTTEDWYRDKRGQGGGGYDDFRRYG